MSALIELREQDLILLRHAIRIACQSGQVRESDRERLAQISEETFLRALLALPGGSFKLVKSGVTT